MRAAEKFNTTGDSAKEHGILVQSQHNGFCYSSIHRCRMSLEISTEEKSKIWFSKLFDYHSKRVEILLIFLTALSLFASSKLTI